MIRRVYPRTPDDDVLDRFYNLVASILTILGLRLGINEKNGNLMLLPLYNIPDQSSSIGSRKGFLGDLDIVSDLIKTAKSAKNATIKFSQILLEDVVKPMLMMYLVFFVFMILDNNFIKFAVRETVRETIKLTPAEFQSRVNIAQNKFLSETPLEYVGGVKIEALKGREIPYAFSKGLIQGIDDALIESSITKKVIDDAGDAAYKVGEFGIATQKQIPMFGVLLSSIPTSSDSKSIKNILGSAYALYVLQNALSGGAVFNPHNVLALFQETTFSFNAKINNPFINDVAETIYILRLMNDAKYYGKTFIFFNNIMQKFKSFKMISKTISKTSETIEKVFPEVSEIDLIKNEISSTLNDWLVKDLLSDLDAELFFEFMDDSGFDSSKETFYFTTSSDVTFDIFLEILEKFQPPINDNDFSKDKSDMINKLNDIILEEGGKLFLPRFAGQNQIGLSDAEKQQLENTQSFKQFVHSVIRIIFKIRAESDDKKFKMEEKMKIFRTNDKDFSDMKTFYQKDYEITLEDLDDKFLKKLNIDTNQYEYKPLDEILTLKNFQKIQIPNPWGKKSEKNEISFERKELKIIGDKEFSSEIFKHAVVLSQIKDLRKISTEDKDELDKFYTSFKNKYLKNMSSYNISENIGWFLGVTMWFYFVLSVVRSAKRNYFKKKKDRTKQMLDIVLKIIPNTTKQELLLKTNEELEKLDKLLDSNAQNPKTENVNNNNNLIMDAAVPAAVPADPADASASDARPSIETTSATTPSTQAPQEAQKKNDEFPFKYEFDSVYYFDFVLSTNSTRLASQYDNILSLKKKYHVKYISMNRSKYIIGFDENKNKYQVNETLTILFEDVKNINEIYGNDEGSTFTFECEEENGIAKMNYDKKLRNDDKPFFDALYNIYSTFEDNDLESVETILDTHKLPNQSFSIFPNTEDDYKIIINNDDDEGFDENGNIKIDMKIDFFNLRHDVAFLIGWKPL
jgi:hypothetical protein